MNNLMRIIAFILTGSFLNLFIMNLTLMVENWVHVATSSRNKIKSYVDVESISVVDGNETFTMYHHFNGSKKFWGTPIEKLIGIAVVNCGDKSIGYKEEQLELIDGRIAVKELRLKLKPVRSNSVDEGILTFVCDYI